MFIDTHCHLLNEYYTNKLKIINNAKENNVNKIIVSGYDDKSNKEILETVNQYIEVYGTLGIHPNNVKKATINNLKFIEQNIKKNKIIAIGEIGLDYHYEGYDKERQKFFFEEQLKIASKYNLPVVIHSRDATIDVINILKKYSIKGIIHSFSDNLKVAQEYTAMGFLIGINGTITFKNSSLIKIVKQIGIDNIVLETDSPYLTPVPYRGKQNEPKNIIHIANFISEKLNISLKTLSEITNKNVNNLFDI